MVATQSTQQARGPAGRPGTNARNAERQQTNDKEQYVGVATQRQAKNKAYSCQLTTDTFERHVKSGVTRVYLSWRARGSDKAPGVAEIVETVGRVRLSLGAKGRPVDGLV